jgi:hypothetical protein
MSDVLPLSLGACFRFESKNSVPISLRLVSGVFPQSQGSFVVWAVTFSPYGVCNDGFRVERAQCQPRRDFRSSFLVLHCQQKPVHQILPFRPSRLKVRRGASSPTSIKMDCRSPINPRKWMGVMLCTTCQPGIITISAARAIQV